MDQLITFEAWPDPLLDTFGCDPEGIYSRLAWLPITGPTSWLVWGTVSTQLRREPEVVWDLAALARAHGLGGRTTKNSPLIRSLHRLGTLRLIAAVDADRFLVRLSAPPVSTRNLAKLPAFVAELHARTFSRPELETVQ